MPMTIAEAEAALAKATVARTHAARAEAEAFAALRQAQAYAADQAKREAVRRTAKARRDAQKLAARIGVEIERERDLDSRPWFVSHPDLIDSPDDPHEGDHYVHCWEDVLSRVQDYEEALAALAKAGKAPA